MLLGTAYALFDGLDIHACKYFHYRKTGITLRPQLMESANHLSPRAVCPRLEK